MASEKMAQGHGNYSVGKLWFELGSPGSKPLHLHPAFGGQEDAPSPGSLNCEQIAQQSLMHSRGLRKACAFYTVSQGGISL